MQHSYFFDFRLQICTITVQNHSKINVFDVNLFGVKKLQHVQQFIVSMATVCNNCTWQLALYRYPSAFCLLRFSVAFVYCLNSQMPFSTKVHPNYMYNQLEMPNGHFQLYIIQATAAICMASSVSHSPQVNKIEITASNNNLLRVTMATTGNCRVQP